MTKREAETLPAASNDRTLATISAMTDEDLPPNRRFTAQLQV
jgi:hypothetical protein